ncbi:MAG: VOC family protein [Actinomycetes bacterium]
MSKKPTIRTIMINADDAHRAVAFWSAFLQLPPGEEEMGPFTFFKRHEGEGFSMAIQKSETPLSPNSAIHVDIAVADLDEAENLIIELGGRVTKKVILDGGFEYRVAEDTEGNHFCIFVEAA